MRARASRLQLRLSCAAQQPPADGEHRQAPDEEADVPRKPIGTRPHVVDAEKLVVDLEAGG